MWNSAAMDALTFLRSRSFRDGRGSGDDEALRWAALERLPTFSQVSRGLLMNICRRFRHSFGNEWTSDSDENNDSDLGTGEAKPDVASNAAAGPSNSLPDCISDNDESVDLNWDAKEAAPVPAHGVAAGPSNEVLLIQMDISFCCDGIF